MEDVSRESEREMKSHLERLVGSANTNPWLEEVWREVSRTNPGSNCKPQQTLLQCSLRNLDHFKIDSKVENVMNVAVLFSETFKIYKRAICGNGNSRNSNCIHDNFNGEKYFNEYILNAKSEDSLPLSVLFYLFSRQI